MSAPDRPPAEVEVGADTVRFLLADQHPDLADLELAEVDGGWDNLVFRLGEDLSVRLPRRSVAAPLIEHEQRWLPRLAADLPLAVPVPVRRGRPGRGFPWAWSVCRWLEGTPAWETTIQRHRRTAEVLGGFLTALHRRAPADAPRNPLRGIPLAGRDARVRADVATLGDRVDGAALLACWEQAVATPVSAGPAVWIHGDLHPGNLLMANGEPVGVIDFGDLAAGDPATDLAVAWMLLPPETRTVLRAVTSSADDHTWGRARGWALTIGLAMLVGAPGDRRLARLGAATLAAVLADPDRP